MKKCPWKDLLEARGRCCFGPRGPQLLDEMSLNINKVSKRKVLKNLNTPRVHDLYVTCRVIDRGFLLIVHHIPLLDINFDSLYFQYIQCNTSEA